ncbi:polysaccharide deacetylase family protein [endosymbiont GvMRE of Glomus versiforme]|uniref:polysaccharide deacetylase family protein n=1 Tax=endosymbiont GvMRE of Glomus versiforme TaxID=2039283 RepID=UPI0015594C44
MTCPAINRSSDERAVNEGHQLASHTWSHPNMTKINREEIIYQMKTLENAMRKIVGLVPRYMRLPFGEGFNNQVKILLTTSLW